MNFPKKTIILLTIITVLTALSVYQLNKIKDLSDIQSLYVEKTTNIFWYLLRDTYATMDIGEILESLGDPDSKRELWQDLDLIKKADEDLKRCELEMIHIIATADEKIISLDKKKNIGYDYVYETYGMKVSTNKQGEIANKVFSNQLDNVITTLLYFVDPPRLTPETKSFFREVASEFKNLSTDIDQLQNPSMHLQDRSSFEVKKRTLNIIESHIEEINSMSLDFIEVLKPRIITPNNN